MGVLCMNMPNFKELGDDIVSLATHIAAATQRLMEMIRWFDEVQGWEEEGRQSCAHWYGRCSLDERSEERRERARSEATSETSQQIDTAVGRGWRCRRHGSMWRVARRLGELPQIDEAFEKGALSYCKVRALTRVADVTDESKLVDAAQANSGHELEYICRGIRDAAATGQEPAERYVRQRTMTDGTVVISARLLADEAALVMKAIDASAEAPAPEAPGPEAQRADALVSLAEDALSGAARSPNGGGEPRRRAERAQLLVHLRVGAGNTARHRQTGATLHDSGQWLSREAFERLSCDCSLVVATSDREGAVLDVGRQRRTVPASIARALMVRDGCCVFPGCAT